MKSEVIHIRISKEKKDKLSNMAKKENRTLNNLVSNIISKQLNKEDGEK